VVNVNVVEELVEVVVVDELAAVDELVVVFVLVKKRTLP